MLYRGFYINLDASADRRDHVETQLAAYKLQAYYERFPACAGNALNLKAPDVSPGNVGCFCSHYQLLKSQLGTATHLHIVEDDVVFSPLVATVIEAQAQSGTLDAWDLFFTDVFVPFDFLQLQELAVAFRKCTELRADGTVERVRSFAIIPLKDRTFASTASYIVNRNSVGKVAAVLEEAVRTEVPLPIDLFYRQRVREGRLNAACLFPFITTVDVPLSQSSIISPSIPDQIQTSLLAAALLRRLFFIHSEPQRLLAACVAQLGGGPMDARDQVLAQLGRFALSEGYQTF